MNMNQTTDRQTLNGGESPRSLDHFCTECGWFDRFNPRAEWRYGCPNCRADETLPVPSFRHVSDREINSALEVLK
jgi:hypothetical protein